MLHESHWSGILVAAIQLGTSTALIPGHVMQEGTERARKSTPKRADMEEGEKADTIINDEDKTHTESAPHAI